MTLRDRVGGVIKRLRDSTTLDEQVSNAVQPRVAQVGGTLRNLANSFRQNVAKPVADTANVMANNFNYMKNVDIAKGGLDVRPGFQRVKQAVQNDPGQFWIGRTQADIVPSAKVVLSPVIGQQKAEDVGYALRGAGQLNLINAPVTLGLDKKGAQQYAKSEPVTERQKRAQDIGRNVYGTILTAPLGGKNMLLNVGKRVIQGGTLGAGMNAVTTVATQHRLPTMKELMGGAGKGIENSWQLAITNEISNKALGALPWTKGLTDEGLAAAWKLSGDAAKMGMPVAKKLVAQAATKTFLRALAEVPAENTMFTFVDKLSGKEKGRFVDAFMRNLPGNIAGNLLYAGVSAGSQGTWQLTTQQRQAMGDALNQTFQQFKGNLKEAMNNSGPEGGFIAFRGEGTKDPMMIRSAQEDVLGNGKYYSTDAEFAGKYGNVKAADLQPQNPLVINNKQELDELGRKMAEGGFKDVQEYMNAKGYDLYQDKVSGDVFVPDAQATMKSQRGAVEPSALIPDSVKKLLGIDTKLEQDLTPQQQADVSAYAKAFSNNDTDALAEFAKKYPQDDFFSQHNRTLGDFQQATQNPDLTAYEKAFNNNDTDKLYELAAKYPQDTRFHVHETGADQIGNSEPLPWETDKQKVDLNDQEQLKQILAEQPQRPATQVDARKDLLIETPEQMAKLRQDIVKGGYSNVGDYMEANGYGRFYNVSGEEVAPDLRGPAIKRPIDQQRADFIDATGKDVAMKPDGTPEIMSDQDVAEKAAKSYLYSDNKDFNGDFKDMMRKFVGQQEASKTIGTQTAAPFAKIPRDQGWKVVEYMEDPQGHADASPEIKQWAENFRTEYDKLYKQAEDAGVNMGYVEDYKPHMWKQDEDQVREAFMTARGNFPNAKDRVLPTYEEGIAMGLTPKYNHPAEILQDYVTRLNRAIGQREFMNQLENDGVIVSAGVAQRNPDFAPINAPGIGRSESRMGPDKTVVGQYYAPTPVANLINKVFGPQDLGTLGRGLEKTAKLSKNVQEVTLSGGLPGTPLNSFAVANLQKELLSGNIVGPVRAFVRAANPTSSAKYFDENADVIKTLQENNIPMHTSYNVDELIDKPWAEKIFGTSVGEAWDRLVGDATFKRFLPMLQIETYKTTFDSAMKDGLTEDEAQQVASQAVKNFYGVIGSDTYVFRDRNLSNATSTFLFAPAFRESMVNFWANNVKALKDPLAKENIKNTKFMIGAAITLAVYDRLNNFFNGHGLMGNPDGKEDKLLIPLGNGTTIGVPFLQSIATVPRGVFRQANYLRKGDISGAVKDASQTYISSLFRPAADIAANSDYFGNEIVDKLDSAGTKFAKNAAYVAKSWMHPYIREGLNVVSEKLPLSDEVKDQLGIAKEPKPWWQSLSQAAELPFRFYGSESIKTAPFWDKYFELKDIATRYDELQFKDKPKALEFLNQNRDKLTEYARMKGVVKNWAENGKNNQLLQDYLSGDSRQVQAAGGYQNVPNNEASRDFIKERLKLGDNVSNEELETAYLGSLFDMPSGNRYEESMRTKKFFSKISDVEDNEYLTEEQKGVLYDRIAQETGLQREELDYYQVAKQDTDIKTPYVMDALDTMAARNATDDDFKKYLVAARRKVNGQAILTNGVVDNLVDEGYLSKEEGKWLKSISQSNASGTATKQAKSGGKGKKKATVKFKMPSAQRMSTPTVTIAGLKPSVPNVRISPMRSGSAGKPRVSLAGLPTSNGNAMLRIANSR